MNLNWENAIVFKNLSKSFNGKKVLDDVSFSVKKKTIHGFIGPNGAGKTTTLSSLVNIVIPDGGEIFVEGKKVGEDPSYNENIGFIPAEPKFPPKMKVKEYINLIADLRDVERDELEKKISISPFKDFVNKKCSDLSTGEKKLLQIFTLNLYKPTILILDEVQNGLDPTNRALLLENIKKARDEGKTILISTHILSDLEELGVDYITMIKGGKIVFDGKKTTDIGKTYEEMFVNEERKKRGSNFNF